MRPGPHPSHFSYAVPAGGEDDSVVVGQYAPGGAPLRFPRFSNAYMLVYVRVDDWARIVFDVDKRDLQVGRGVTRPAAGVTMTRPAARPLVLTGGLGLNRDGGV